MSFRLALYLRAAGRRAFLLTLFIGCASPASYAQAPLTLGGDPAVDPGDFVVTVFATDLNFPIGMVSLDDGSLVVAVTNGDRFFGSSSGSLVRLSDTDGDGVSDQRTVLTDSVPGGRLTSLVRSGDLLVVTGAGSPITIYRLGSDQMAVSEVGRLMLAYPGSWQHSHTTLVIRRGIDEDRFELFFQVGSAENFAASTGSVELTSDIGAVGSLAGDAIHRIEIMDDGEQVSATYLGQIAGGLRNASGLAFEESSGDLYIAENGIDGLENASEAFSADELNYLPADQLGGPVEHYGFPDTYEEYRTGEQIGGIGIAPVVTYQPVPDPNTGDESEGPNQLVFSPEQFPAYLDSGLFVGFHGQFSDAGPENRENPLVFTNPDDGSYFHLVGVDEPGVGHLNGLLARTSELFVADMSSDGGLGPGGFEAGRIYRIYHPPSPPIVSLDPSLSDSTIFQSESIELAATAFDTQDGVLDDTIEWSSTLDGVIGTGSSVTFSSMITGTHTISARVTDSQGAGAVTEFIVNVRRAPARFTECPLRPDGPEDGTLVISPANTPLLNDRPIGIGTEIAVYRKNADECFGVGVWENAEISIPIDGDDETTDAQDGMPNGAFMEIGLWDADSDQVYRGPDVTIEWESGPDVESSGLFVPGATYAVASMHIEQHALAAPTLSSPSDGSTDVGLTTTLIWSGVSEAAAYQLQLDDDVSFSSTEIDRQVVAQTAAGVFGLNHDITYYWRVRAIDTNGVAGEWSLVWTFSTLSEPFTEAPELITPISGATDLSLHPEFTWNDIDRADHYLFQLSEDASYSSLVIEELVADTVVSVYEPLLAAGATYHWRVGAIAGGEQGDWSESRSFSTASDSDSEQADRRGITDALGIFPNPAQDRMAIEFGTDRAVHVHLLVLDVSGREVALVADRRFIRGVHRLNWNSAELANGVYVLHLQAGDRTRTKTFTVLR